MIVHHTYQTLRGGQLPVTVCLYTHPSGGPSSAVLHGHLSPGLAEATLEQYRTRAAKVQPVTIEHEKDI